MPWAVVGAVVGGVISADAADSASDAQVGAAKDATALQKYMFDQQTAMHKPWLDAGTAGLNKLSYLLGLSPTGFGGQGSPSGGLETADQIRARLSGAYTTRAPGPMTPGTADSEGGAAPTAGPEIVTVDNAKLDAAVRAEMARQQKALALHQRLTAQGARGDSEYGSLLDKFSLDDFEADPGYQFRLDEGQKALDRRLAAGGQFYSGRSLKDTINYNQGMAKQEFGAAFDRFNVGNTNRFNRLAALSGIGQTAANQTGAAGQNYANQAGSNMIGAGNAQAAGMVGQANAWNGAIGQGVSAYQQNSLMNQLQAPSSYGGYSSYAGNGGGAGNYNYGGGF